MRKDLSEEVKSKLRKILALAESGIEGEQKTAKIKLQALLVEYGLTLEELADDAGESIWIFGGISNKIEQSLWAQIVFKVKDVQQIRIGTKGRNARKTSCTEAQANEIADMYKWHKRNFKKELLKMEAEFFEAYIIKHKLFPATPSKSQSDEPVDFERLQRIMMYNSQMSNDTYYKSLTK
jgi:hypothetical protein